MRDEDRAELDGVEPSDAGDGPYGPSRMRPFATPDEEPDGERVDTSLLSTPRWVPKEEQDRRERDVARARIVENTGRYEFEYHPLEEDF